MSGLREYEGDRARALKRLSARCSCRGRATSCSRGRTPNSRAPTRRLPRSRRASAPTPEVPAAPAPTEAQRALAETLDQQKLLAIYDDIAQADRAFLDTHDLVTVPTRRSDHPCASTPAGMIPLTGDGGSMNPPRRRPLERRLVERQAHGHRVDVDALRARRGRAQNLPALGHGTVHAAHGACQDITCSCHLLGLNRRFAGSPGQLPRRGRAFTRRKCSGPRAGIDRPSRSTACSARIAAASAASCDGGYRARRGGRSSKAANWKRSAGQPGAAWTERHAVHSLARATPIRLLHRQTGWWTCATAWKMGAVPRARVPRRHCSPRGSIGRSSGGSCGRTGPRCRQGLRSAKPPARAGARHRTISVRQAPGLL